MVEYFRFPDFHRSFIRALLNSVYNSFRGGGRGGYQQNGQAEFRQLLDTVYITGLPENTSNEDLINHFSVCGEVKVMGSNASLECLIHSLS